MRGVGSMQSTSPFSQRSDVFLSRTLKSAELVRVDGDLSNGIELLRAGKADVYTTSIDGARVMVNRMPEAKIVGAFHTVTFAVAMQKGRSAAALGKLTQLVNEAKAAGIVEKALEQADAQGVRIVP